jgi:hypothetical protein
MVTSTNVNNKSLNESHKLMSSSRLTGIHENSLPIIHIKRSTTNLKTIKPDFKLRSHHKAIQNLHEAPKLVSKEMTDMEHEINEKVSMIKKNMLNATFDHFAYGQLSKHNPNEQSFQLVKQSNCETNQQSPSPTSSLASKTRKTLNDKNHTESQVNLQESRAKPQIYKADVDIVKSLGSSLNQIPNIRQVVKRTKTQLYKNDEEPPSRSNFLKSISNKTKKPDRNTVGHDESMINSSRDKFDARIATENKDMKLNIVHHAKTTKQEDQKKAEDKSGLKKIAADTEYSSVELINTFDINQADVTNKEVRTRIKVWLSQVNKCVDSARPPSSVSWFGETKYNKKDLRTHFTDHPNRDDSAMSDFNTDEEQIFKYNRILDKTFCIVYND